MLRLFKEKRGAIKIDQKHPKFDGTDYANFEFELSVELLTPTQEEEIRQRNLKRGAGVDLDAFLRELFVRQVVGWTGISLEESATSECTDENKALVFEHNFGFAQAVINAVRDEANKARRFKDAEAKN